MNDRHDPIQHPRGADRDHRRTEDTRAIKAPGGRSHTVGSPEPDGDSPEEPEEPEERDELESLEDPDRPRDPEERGAPDDGLDSEEPGTPINAEPPTSASARSRTPRSRAAARAGRPPRSGIALLMLGAAGVVFGDIGTSPLYALQTVFSTHHHAVAPTPGDVLGVISMVFWCLMLIVSVTYVGVILRADNAGEGGILSLSALIGNRLGPRSAQAAIAMVLAIVGASLFAGDSLITPAISVLSAVEGLEVVRPDLAEFVIPAAVGVLAALFAVQRWGTGTIGKAFGPIMVCWFLVAGALGLPHVLAHPGVLRAILPTYALAFAIDRPFVAFLAMGSVVLAVTGAEALYADMGHFGRRPIALAWFALVLPALLLCYFGQGALVLENPAAVRNPFFELAPDWARIPLVALATAATVIASQAVISGAFSVSRQAMRASLLPRLRIRQTSSVHGGQIYVPIVNMILFVGVMALVLGFGSSQSLAAAYGLSVTGTLLLELSLFLLLALRVWRWPLSRVMVMAVVVGGVELVLLAANVIKLPSGGWLPLVVAGLCLIVMLTWRRGSRIIFGRREEMEGPITDFVTELHHERIPRVPGLAVYPHGNPRTVPLALRSNVAVNHVLHERVIVLTMKNIGVPHVPETERIIVDDLDDPRDGIVHVTCRVGFLDSQDVPAALRLAVGRTPELDLDPDVAIYMLSVFRIEAGSRRSMARWRKKLFLVLEGASANRTQVLHLPSDRTIVMGAEAEL